MSRKRWRLMTRRNLLRGVLWIEEICGSEQIVYVSVWKYRPESGTITERGDRVVRDIHEPAGVKDVRISDKSLWGERARVARDIGLPYQWKALNDAIPGASPSYAIENLRIAAGRASGEFHGMVFQDSDLAKWLEAVAYQLAANPDYELERAADEVIDLIAEAQDSDGYFNTYFILAEPDKRWTNLRDWHELYCAGHLIEAAVAYYDATGKRKLLDIVIKLADHIDSVLGPEPGKKRGYPGHEEIELALIKLYRTTKMERFLRLAKYFIDERGKQPCYFEIEATARGDSEYPTWIGVKSHAYWQAHKPVREQTTAEGHAVRAMYLYSGMVDVALETHDDELLRVCERLWDNVVNRRMYVIGAIGSNAHGEAFSFDYDLPSDTAYAETCASIGLAMWANRMLQYRLDSKYSDAMELALYNTVLSGMALDGTKYFYVNPLEVWPEAADKRKDLWHVKYERQPWFGCACCPPNIMRTVSSLGSYIYSQGQNAIGIHLFVDSKASLRAGGQNITVIQTTDYPDSEDVCIEISPECEAEFSVAVRIPGWCKDAQLKVNGVAQNLTDLVRSGYVYITRRWAKDDRIELTLPMPVQRVRSNPAVRETVGKVAVQRGPVVYCLEEVDNGPNLQAILLPIDAQLTCHFDQELLGGTTVIDANGFREDETAWYDKLYCTRQPRRTPVRVKFIPYWKWANRRPGEMRVWVRETL